MPLVDRTDSVFIVVDTQRRFVMAAGHSQEESAAAAATLDRLVWLAGIATLLEIRRS